MTIKEAAVFFNFYGIMERTDVYAGEPAARKRWKKLSVHNSEE